MAGGQATGSGIGLVPTAGGNIQTLVFSILVPVSRLWQTCDLAPAGRNAARHPMATVARVAEGMSELPGSRRSRSHLSSSRDAYVGSCGTSFF